MLIATLLTGLALSPGASAQEPPQPSLFAGVETHMMPNGLKVWYKYLPDDPVVSISVALPVGADKDPPGKEQLAHFTEHMLFSDQPGRTEEEIKREIEELGGVYNASVTVDRSFYYVRIGSEHGLFALEWLHRVLAPHAMAAEVVERQREPVALEVGARPRQLFDWLWAYYLKPPWLRTPGFWEREFGIETWSSRDYYPYASLNRITPDDLRWFYDTYYVPSLMTLTVVGNLQREAVLDKIAETFATLPSRPKPGPAASVHDPARYRQVIAWDYRPNVSYNNRFKFYGLAAGDEVMLVFISQLLGKRLNDRLRFGERKATYGMSVGLVKRGSAAYLHVSGGIKEDEFEFARSVVDGELDALRTGSLSQAEFEADRAAVTRRLRVANSASEDLERWVGRYFYNTRVHRDFPDLVTLLEGLTREEIRDFVRARFVPERQVLAIVHPHPLTQGVLALLGIALVWLTVRGARRWLTRPIDMTRIRYVARFRLPRLYLILATASLLALVAVAGRLLVYAFQLASDRFLVTVDSFVVQCSAYGLMMMVTVSLLVLLLAHIPRKLLLFDDRLLIKHLAYRSVPIPVAEVEEISLGRFRAVWLSRRIWKCIPLTIGLLTPAIYLRRRDGWAYFFSVRDRDELLEAVKEISAGAAEVGHPTT